MIIVECYNDEYLIKSMGFSKIRHEGCKGKVLEKVRKHQNPEVFGIIDEDPDSNQPSDLNDYIQKDHKSTIKLLVNRNDDNRRIIQISPYLEEWILNRAKQNKISPASFNLPNDPHQLHGTPHIHKKQNFQKFLHILIERDEEAKKIKEWLMGY